MSLWFVKIIQVQTNRITVLIMITIAAICKEFSRKQLFYFFYAESNFTKKLNEIENDHILQIQERKTAIYP